MIVNNDANNKAVDSDHYRILTERLGVTPVEQSTSRTAVEKAHLENMESSERLRQSINALTERLGNIEQVLKLYLESKAKGKGGGGGG